MHYLHEATVSCPYCGEGLEVLLDPEDVGQEYIEDCQVCCRPITFMLFDNGDESLQVVVQGENEV
ncbi:CPXCG motif-containing cysteine-rich protein [Leucothrix sargassi]|nr:CPXCG motif-containing cysteine-rich protein [Leucothrix sargassi]